MRLAGIRPGDLVEVDRKGRRFVARVTGLLEHELLVEPLERNITYRTARAREVIGHWRRANGGRP